MEQTVDITWISTRPNACWQYRKSPRRSNREPNLYFTPQELQPVKGFGGAFNELGWVALGKLKQKDQDRVMRALFDTEQGCGFTFCRVPIGASDFALDWYSYSETPDDYVMKHFSIERDRKHLIPYIKRAMRIRPDLTLFASPWSPPTWMKTKKAFNSGILRWEPKVLRAYALYFKRFIEAYADQGIRIEQVHIQNEPRSDQKFPSCLWTGPQMRDFIRDYIGPLFERDKVNCEIWAGTIEKGVYFGSQMDLIGTQGFAEWAHCILSDPDTRKYVGGVGFQWDGKGMVQRTHETWPNIPLIQTENECGNGTNTWTYARYVFDLIWHFFTNGVRAYTYWNMILPEGGVSTWNFAQNSMITVTDDGRAVFNPEFYVMRHFAQFVRPGARRLGLAGPWSGFALGFVNTDGSRVLVLANPYETPGRVTLDTGDGTVALSLPGQSFHTLVL